MFTTADLLKNYEAKKAAIKARLAEFRAVGRNATDAQLFAELAFCLCTPQSKARAADAAIKDLLKSGALLTGGFSDLSRVLEKNGVRFPGNKANFIVEARYHLMREGFGMRQLLKRFDSSPITFREWLVNNVKGLGYKEASHFIRNIGRGEQLAILDRHVLKNLADYDAISEIPDSLPPKRYLEIEEKMRGFATKIEIPLAELDLLFWSEETGEIFK